MSAFHRYLDGELSRGRAYFCREEGMAALGLSPEIFAAAASRSVKKQRLISPWRGFYLILRPEDKSAGTPSPERWIDSMMKYLGIDYRISLLSAAAFHGSSLQLRSVFQVIAPQQLRDFDIGCHRIQFIYQAPDTFAKLNQSSWLGLIEEGEGMVNVAGIELTLLDAMRYFHKASGINVVARIVKDLGMRANPHKLATAAVFYENPSVRRLGYLLERVGHARQACALVNFATKAKSMKPLDPSVSLPLPPGSLVSTQTKDRKWKLIINKSLEINF